MKDARVHSIAKESRALKVKVIGKKGHEGDRMR